MSRVGKKPITIPLGVQVELVGERITVKGPRGQLARAMPNGVQVTATTGHIVVSRTSNEKQICANHGLVRALIQNMVNGVTHGVERKLEINGVGYKAEVSGDKLQLALGYSHPIRFELPRGVSAKVDKNVLSVTGIDHEVVGQTCAVIRSLRPPEPYKGKGIRYVEEVVKRKVGKSGAA